MALPTGVQSRESAGTKKWLRSPPRLCSSCAAGLRRLNVGDDGPMEADAEAETRTPPNQRPFVLSTVAFERSSGSRRECECGAGLGGAERNG
jgi:hypothetical protein